MPIENVNDETQSIFSDDGYTFSLTNLQSLVAQHLQQPCTLSKIAEGGNHKVYDVIVSNDLPATSVVRVASNDFPVDKLESEVATLKYILDKTSVPVPKVLGWNSDRSNQAGVEYMVIEKIPGVPANDVWDKLALSSKETLVRGVARSLLSLFDLRFSEAGSLYLLEDGSIKVGPLVTTPFFRALDSEVRFPEEAPLDLSHLRGPFAHTTEYLSSAPKTELYILQHQRNAALQELDEDEEKLAMGKRVLEKVLQLIEIYPGERGIAFSPITEAAKPFSFRLDDFRLSNIMVDEASANVLGLIDFECTTTAPLWMCAGWPHWLEEVEGGSKEQNQELEHLRRVFDETIGAEGERGIEWLAVAEQGRLFRDFGDMLTFQVLIWASKDMEKWVDRRLEFAARSPGVGLPELTAEEEAADRYGNLNTEP